MSLNEQLEQTKAGFIAKVPAMAQADILRHIKELQESGFVFGLTEGIRPQLYIDQSTRRANNPL